MQLVKKGALRDSTITGAFGALKEFLEATLDLRVLQDLAIATIIVALTPCHATGGTKVEVSEVQCIVHISQGLQTDLVL